MQTRTVANLAGNDNDDDDDDDGEDGEAPAVRRRQTDSNPIEFNQRKGSSSSSTIVHS